jgi:DNA-directed RNA polymerase specialized sigma24 family protein
MKKDWILTQGLFDELLSWLNSDRELAGQEYEDIRRRLIKLFTCRQCHEPEALSDETINRVANKVKEIKDTFVGPRAPYFYAVANKVHLESLRPKPLPQPPPPALNSDEKERDYACLEQCMEQQSPANRRLVLEYYRGEKRAKIDHRKKLAEQYGIALNALRIRAHRIRASLQECVEICISQAPA